MGSLLMSQLLVSKCARGLKALEAVPFLGPNEIIEHDQQWRALRAW